MCAGTPKRFRAREPARNIVRRRTRLTREASPLRVRALPKDRHDERNRAEPGAILPGADPDAAAVLGRRGLRHPAALRHGDGGRHLPSGDDPAGAWAAAVARRLCPALAAAEGRALRREPEPLPALLPVPGHPEAEPAEPPGALSRLAR